MGQQGGGFGQQGRGLPGQGYMNSASPGMQYAGWPQQSQARQDVRRPPPNQPYGMDAGGPIGRPAGPYAPDRGGGYTGGYNPPMGGVTGGAPSIPGMPQNFGPLPPGGMGSFNGTNYGPPGTDLNPLGYGDFARQRVQQGVAGGGGYSTQDLSDAGMSQRDLTAMIEQQRNGTLGRVNMTGDQATAAQELARQRAYSTPAFRGLLGAVRR